MLLIFVVQRPLQHIPSRCCASICIVPLLPFYSGDKLYSLHSLQVQCVKMHTILPYTSQKFVVHVPK